MQQVTVLGTGVLGSQIIFQSAYMGKDVVAYDVSDEILTALPHRWQTLEAHYREDLPDATQERLDRAVAHIRASSNLADAVRGAEVIIEAIPEQLSMKQEVWGKVGALAAPEAIFCTNSSTFLPSDIAPFTGRPDRFLALHFANTIWKNNTAEVMGHSGTDPQVFERVAAFAQEIDMVPIRLHKEQPGYVLNSLLVPLLNAAADLWVHGVASIEDIDATWRIATGAPLGPFQIYDIVGMMTPYYLSKDSTDPVRKEFAERLKHDYIDQGRMGRDSGRGFYDYR